METNKVNSIFFIGVDGGASKCKVRVEDVEGKLLGEEISGSANIRLSISDAWQSIYAALNKILIKHDLSLKNPHHQFYAGMGLAGCEVQEAYQTFCDTHHPFKGLKVTTDSHTACLGAHNGEDGAIIIAGTGVVGFQLENNLMTKVGGWGFPHDDEGGGAWLGLEAMRITLQWLDKRLSSSRLAEVIFAHFNRDQEALVHWAHHANSTRFATLAPFVIEQCEQQDESAIALMNRAALAINKIGETLTKLQKDPTKILPCALIGGITSFLEPYLNVALRSRLRAAKTSPDVGAIRLIREHVGMKGK